MKIAPFLTELHQFTFSFYYYYNEELYILEAFNWCEDVNLYEYIKVLAYKLILFYGHSKMERIMLLDMLKQTNK
jgi:hypothetical protein